MWSWSESALSPCAVVISVQNHCHPPPSPIHLQLIISSALVELISPFLITSWSLPFPSSNHHRQRLRLHRGGGTPPLLKYIDVMMGPSWLRTHQRNNNIICSFRMKSLLIELRLVLLNVTLSLFDSVCNSNSTQTFQWLNFYFEYTCKAICTSWRSHNGLGR